MEIDWSAELKGLLDEAKPFDDALRAKLAMYVERAAGLVRQASKESEPALSRPLWNASKSYTSTGGLAIWSDSRRKANAVADRLFELAVKVAIATIA